jgi:hypothetical protein
MRVATDKTLCCCCNTSGKLLSRKQRSIIVLATDPCGMTGERLDEGELTEGSMLYAELPLADDSRGLDDSHSVKGLNGGGEGKKVCEA